MDPMETWLCLVTINFGGVPEQIFPKNIDFWELVDALIRLRKRYEDMRIWNWDLTWLNQPDPIPFGVPITFSPSALKLFILTKCLDR